MKLVAYIVRHGASGDDEQYNSPENDPLDKQGIAQAQELADYFLDKRIGAIKTSGLKRAKQTAGIVGSKLGILPKTDDRLNSLDVGNVKDLESSDEADRVIHHHLQNPHETISGGESFNRFRGRVHPALEQAVEEGSESPVLVITHHSIQHEAGNLFNGDHDSALSKPGGAVAVYKTSEGYHAVPVFKPERGTEMKKKHHKFHKLTVEMHKDGSHTSHLHHEDGEAHDIRAAHGDHDSMVDHLMQHTSAPNPGEAQADAGDHGVAPDAAAAAGLPAPAAAPAAGA